jgi:fumarate reductase subunit C
MSATAYHPRWHRVPVSVWWWLRKRSYALFVLRETSSVFVALFAGVTLLQLRAVSAGPEAHARFAEWLRTPGVLVLHAVVLGFVLLHAFTWFHLAPKAMAVRLRGKRVPDAAIVAGNYAGFLVASALVAFFLLRG